MNSFKNKNRISTTAIRNEDKEEPNHYYDITLANEMKHTQMKHTQMQNGVTDYRGRVRQLQKEQYKKENNVTNITDALNKYRKKRQVTKIKKLYSKRIKLINVKSEPK